MILIIKVLEQRCDNSHIYICEWRLSEHHNPSNSEVLLSTFQNNILEKLKHISLKQTPFNNVFKMIFILQAFSYLIKKAFRIYISTLN